MNKIFFLVPEYSFEKPKLKQQNGRLSSVIYLTAENVNLKKVHLIALLAIVLLSCMCYTSIQAQQDTASRKALGFIGRLDEKTLSVLNKKYQKLEKKVSEYSQRSLERFQKQESKLQKKLASKDCLAAKATFVNIDSKYAGLIQKVKQQGEKSGVGILNDYLPGLDSLQTSFNFLSTAGAKIPGIPTEKIEQFKRVSDQLKSLQSQMQQASDIKKFIRERQQLLQAQLNKFGLGDQLKQINKQVYYYQQQLSEYKSILRDPDKLEQKLLAALREHPAFKEFMSKNSLLAQLFPRPSGYGTADALQGLQTRVAMQQQLGQRLGGSGASQQQYVQQQVQQAQGELNKLKDRLNKVGGGGSDLAMPDFTPNTQKTKSFWNRIEYGLNIQSQRSTYLLPTTSDITLTAGYKLNDKSTIGIGAGYKLGWGKSISDIHLTSQGASLRSYLDIKIKGSIWISGGYEMNYQKEFTRIIQLQDINAWQKSGLIGLTKKYKIGKKGGNLQLLWDFLSYNQVPKTQAVKFRVGYTF